MDRRLRVLILTFSVMIGALGSVHGDDISSRPWGQNKVFDQAKLLKYSLDSKEESLKFFEKKYKIEMLIVTVPSLDGHDIVQAAADMMTKWNIGREYNGQGILILLADKEKQVKVEVGAGLEGIYTDLFCGYIERKQLQPYFQNDQVDLGLSAVMENFIGRAEGKLTDETIKQKMDGALSYGAGIAKDIKIGRTSPAPVATGAQQDRFGAQPTPEALYDAWLVQLKECAPSTGLGMYTEESNVIWTYAPQMGRAQCDAMLGRVDLPHEIKVSDDGDFAVLLFFNDRKAGPIFMRRSDAGWQLNVHATSKWIHNDFDNKWYEMGNYHMYHFAFKDKPYADYVKDLDFADDYNIFSPVASDYLNVIARMEEALAVQPDNADGLIVLGELFMDLGVFQKAMPLFQKAMTLAPNDHRPYRGLGLINRDTLTSYATALKSLIKNAELDTDDAIADHYVAVTYWRMAKSGQKQEYLNAIEWMKKYLTKQNANQVYGRTRIGYFYYKADMNAEAKKWFEEALTLDPSDKYAQRMLNTINGKE